jgi:hypothetical protein
MSIRNVSAFGDDNPNVPSIVRLIYRMVCLLELCLVAKVCKFQGQRQAQDLVFWVGGFRVLSCMIS